MMQHIYYIYIEKKLSGVKVKELPLILHHLQTLPLMGITPTNIHLLLGLCKQKLKPSIGLISLA